MELACRHNKNQTQTVIMLTREHQSCQGIVRINCKPLDSAELRRLDKNERGLVTFLSNLTKGEKKRATKFISSASAEVERLTVLIIPAPKRLPQIHKTDVLTASK